MSEFDVKRFSFSIGKKCWASFMLGTLRETVAKNGSDGETGIRENQTNPGFCYGWDKILGFDLEKRLNKTTRKKRRKNYEV